MADKLLCILGSEDSDVMELAATDFFSHTGNGHSKIVVISDKHSESNAIGAFLSRHSITKYTVLHPDLSDYNSLTNAVKLLKSASGIILDTTCQVYHACSLQPLKGLIVELYNAGVPVLGNVEQSLLFQTMGCAKKENFLRGSTLGLISDHILSSPTSSTIAHLADSMQRLGVRHGVEIGQKSCAVFINGRLAHTRGDGVMHIEAHVRRKMRISQMQ